MQKVYPVFFEHAIEVPDDEAESLRKQGLLREPPEGDPPADDPPKPKEPKP